MGNQKLIAVIVLAASAVAGLAAADGIARARELQLKGLLPEAREAWQGAFNQSVRQADHSGAAEALSGLAQIDLLRGRYTESVSEAAQALSRFKDLRSKTGQARILTTRGNALLYSGKPRAAYADFEAALAIARQIGDREGQITRLNNLGAVLYMEGRYGEALTKYQSALDSVNESPSENWAPARRQLTLANLAALYQRVGQFNRALELYREMGSAGGSLPVREQAQMQSNMGTLYRRLGDPRKAMDTYLNAQRLFHQSALLSGEVGVLNNIGIAQTLDFSDPITSARTFTSALRMAKGSGGSQLQMTSLLYRAEAFLRTGDLTRAGTDFDQSRLMAAQLNAREEQWRAAYGLARIADRKGDLGTSNQLLRNAIRTIEGMRSTSAMPTGRTGFLIDKRDVYDLLIEHQAVIPSANVEDVFRLIELSRSRDLQDKLGQATPGLATLRLSLPDDTAIVEYWMGKHGIAAIWITARRVELRYRGVSVDELAAIGTLPAALADATQAGWADKTREVSRLLFATDSPVANGNLRRLIVVPDEGMAQIPFEALTFGTDTAKLLVESIAVSYLPYAGAFTPHAFTPQRNRRRSITPPWKTTLAAYADPPGDADQRLPGAVTEIRTVADAVGGRSHLYVGRDASRDAVGAELRDLTPILHLATHAFADFDDPDRSWILFAPRPGSASPDHMFLREAAALSAANVALITVSACDSGAGKSIRGEGVQSFAGAFLAAGARSVLTSLWLVGDQSSAEFMGRYYARLSRGETLAEALRNTKLEFLHSGNSSAHPAHWAAFVLAGDGESKIPVTIGWQSCALAIVTVAALMLFFLRKSVRTRAERVSRSQDSHSL